MKTLELFTVAFAFFFGVMLALGVATQFVLAWICAILDHLHLGFEAVCARLC